MACSSNKRCTLSIEKKLQVLETLKWKKPEEVCKEFNIGYSTMNKIKQKEEEIRNTQLNNGNLNRKRKRESPNEEIGLALVAWFHQFRTQAKITGPVMLNKAKEIAISMGHRDFQPSRSWLERLKSRHNIKFGKGTDEPKKNLQRTAEARIVNEPMPRISRQDALMHLSMVRRYLEESVTEYNSYNEESRMVRNELIRENTVQDIIDKSLRNF